MSEFDELVARDGVILAGRFGPDWRVAEHKSKGLFMEVPEAFDLAPRFCAAVSMMFSSIAAAMDDVSHGGGFDPTSWQPPKGWAFTGGDYSIAVYGDLFLIAETEKVGSFDELRSLLHKTKP